MVMPQPPGAWLAHPDLFNLLELAGWEVMRFERQQLFPFGVPLVSPALNRVAVRLPGVRHLGITLCVTARPVRAPALTAAVSCSVIVPARNEAGNIRAALDRIPVLGRGTEVILSKGTAATTPGPSSSGAAAYRGPHRVRALQQPGKGKWDAVHAGFAVATGDVLVIQDADLTAPPEELPKFYDAIVAAAPSLPTAAGWSIRWNGGPCGS